MSSSLQLDINKFPFAHNRKHGFRKFKTLQGCPNLAHHKLSRSTKDIPSPRKTRSDSESRLQDISTMVKQDQQDHLTMLTNADRSCTYLVLKAHWISKVYKYQHNPSCQGTVPHGALVWTNTRRSTGPGFKNKDDPRALENPGEKGIGRKW